MPVKIALFAKILSARNDLNEGVRSRVHRGVGSLYRIVSFKTWRAPALSHWYVTREGVSEVGGLGGVSTPAQLEDIRAGYARLMTFVAEREAELWVNDDDGSLALFEQEKVRFTPRPTATYACLLDHLRQPAFLVSGAAFSVELDSLARAYLDSPEQKLFSSLLMAEQVAVAQGDVPYFTTHIGQPDLHHSHGIIPDFFVWPPIHLPGPVEQAQQQAYIRDTLGRAPYLSPDTPRDLLAMARTLGELLAQCAVPVAEDGLGWVAFRPQFKSVVQQYDLVGEDLYEGQAEQAWAFQQTLYDAQENRWQDIRNDEPVCLDNWCHGSAGIGLAGVAMGEKGHTAVEIALHHLRQPVAYTTYALDTLCCGRFGQMELGEQATAWEMAERFVAESVARGSFQLYDDVPAHLFNPTFFRGVAGIGYTLLRMVHPLPCVLRMG